MSNYTTRKNQFENIKEKLTKNNLVNIKIKHFTLECSYSENKNIFLSYKTTSNHVCCKKCNKMITRNKGYRFVYPLIGKYNNKVIIARFAKKVFQCLECKVSTVQETPDVKFKCQISTSIKTCILEDLAKSTTTYTQVSIDNFVSTSSVIRYFDMMAVPEINYKNHVSIGIDEIRFIPSVGNYQCTIIDGLKGTVIDILHNREIKTVKKYLSTNFPHVEIISQDLWKTYKNAGLAANPEVKIVADIFHVVRTSMWAFNRGRIRYFENNNIRQNIKWRSYSFSIRKFEPSTRKKMKFLISKDKFMKVNHQAKEMFIAACRMKLKEDFIRVYESFVRYVKKHDLREYNDVIRMVKNWRTEILNATETTVSNGVTERRNSDCKQAKRNARGFMNLPRATKLIKYRVNIKIEPNSYNFG